MTSRTKDGKFLPGSSGNPAGRTKGSGRIASLRASIQDHIPAIITRLVTEAKAGDVMAARLLLERVIPAVKPEAATVHLPELGLLGSDAVSQARAVIDAIADGRLPPDTGAGLLASLANHGRLLELGELEKRIAALEKDHELTQ